MARPSELRTLAASLHFTTRKEKCFEKNEKTEMRFIGETVLQLTAKSFYMRSTTFLKIKFITCFQMSLQQKELLTTAARNAPTRETKTHTPLPLVPRTVTPVTATHTIHALYKRPNNAPPVRGLTHRCSRKSLPRTTLQRTSRKHCIH